jgi:hypothetical protein
VVEGFVYVKAADSDSVAHSFVAVSLR